MYFFRLKANVPKNRYTDVLCLDQSRVTLPVIDDDPSSDYINANYVDGYMQKNAFISTQGYSTLYLPHIYWSHIVAFTCDQFANS